MISVLDTKFATVKQVIKAMVVPTTWPDFRTALCDNRSALGTLLWGKVGEGGLRDLLEYIAGIDMGEGVPPSTGVSAIEPPYDLPDGVDGSILLSALALTVNAVRHPDRDKWVESLGSSDNQVLGEAPDEPGGLLFWLEPAEPTYRYDFQSGSGDQDAPTVQSYAFGNTTLFYREVRGRYGTTEGEYSLDGTFTPEDRARTTGFLARWDELSAAATHQVPPNGTVVYGPWKVPENDPPLWARQVADGEGGVMVQYSVDESFSKRGLVDAWLERPKKDKDRKIRLSHEQRKAIKPAVGPDAQVSMGASYVEGDVGLSKLVLYLPEGTLKQRKVTREYDSTSRSWIFKQNGERVKAPHTYGWVLDPDHHLYLFEPSLELTWELVTADGEVKSHDIPGSIVGSDADLKKFGNVEKLLDKLQGESRVVEVMLRHSSHVRGGKVIGAGICEVVQAEVPGTDQAGTPLYKTIRDGQEVFVSESDLPRAKDGVALAAGFDQVFSMDYVLAVADNDSGHYKPLVENHQNAINWLLSNRFMLRASSVRFVDSNRSDNKGTTYKYVAPRAGSVMNLMEQAGGAVAYDELEARHGMAEDASVQGFRVHGITEEIEKARQLALGVKEISKGERKGRVKDFSQAYQRCAVLFTTAMTEALDGGDGDASSRNAYMDALKKVKNVDSKQLVSGLKFLRRRIDQYQLNIALLLRDDELPTSISAENRSGVGTVETNYAETISEVKPRSLGLGHIGAATPQVTPYTSDNEDLSYASDDEDLETAEVESEPQTVGDENPAADGEQQDDHPYL
ncbi:hypothetical protein [Streptomyces sp. NPDC126514]|uniref:hypothetical protein n=1 Tax=Streptomyces sp. NPDC126514 TaxID=3155210 RepID=UPI00331D4DCA